MTQLFATRDDLRAKLRDLLVEEVRQGVVDGARAKSIAEDIIDELELSPEGDTPLAIFERLHARYPGELGALKAKLDRVQHEQQDQDLARQMAEQIALGNFEGAVGLSRGKALEALVLDAPAPQPAAAPAAPAVEAPVAAPVPEAVAPPAVVPLPLPGIRSRLGGMLRAAADALGRAAALLEGEQPTKP